MARRCSWPHGRSDGWRSLLLLAVAGGRAVLPWWGVLQTRVVQVGDRAGVRVVGWRQRGGAPWQGRPALTVMAGRVPLGAALTRRPDPPQPVQLRRQRPGAVLQVQQVAMAVERSAVAAAGPAAGVAGLRGARTGIVGPWPAGAVAALIQSRSGRDGDLPGPAGPPAGHPLSPPLAWSPGSDQPTKQPGTAQPKPHGTPPPYSPVVRPAGYQRFRSMAPGRGVTAAAGGMATCAAGQAGGRARTAGTTTTPPTSQSHRPDRDPPLVAPSRLTGMPLPRSRRRPHPLVLLYAPRSDRRQLAAPPEHPWSWSRYRHSPGG
jgi:hypothetical protein